MQRSIGCNMRNPPAGQETNPQPVKMQPFDFGFLASSALGI
jgi:hypothetical protein